MQKPHAKLSNFCDIFCVVRQHPFEGGSSAFQYIDVTTGNSLCQYSVPFMRTVLF